MKKNCYLCTAITKNIIEMKRIANFLFFLLIAGSIAAQTTNSTSKSFVATWATAIEPTGAGDMPRTTNLTDCSLREIVHVSLGGENLRLQLSNVFGSEAVEIKSIFIADACDSSDIVVPSARYLTFNGKRNVDIAAGSHVVCDVVKYQLRPLQRLSITICYGKAPQNAASHRGSRTTSYIMQGAMKPKQRFVTSEKQDHWYNIAAIEVETEESGTKPVVVAALGNSITDGRGTTTNAQNRWTDLMAETLQGRVGVLNLGIGGNCVVRGGLSQPALERFDRDILEQTGVTHLIVFEGVNDIGSSPNVEQTAKELIDAYKTFIRKAHEHGLKVYGGTITPFGRSFYWSYFHEAARQSVNEWIRQSGEFDGVLDFDEVMRDPEAPTQLRADWQEDWLHPNAAGYKVMGEFAGKWMQQQLDAQ